MSDEQVRQQNERAHKEHEEKQVEPIRASVYVGTPPDRTEYERARVRDFMQAVDGTNRPGDALKPQFRKPRVEEIRRLVEAVMREFSLPVD